MTGAPICLLTVDAGDDVELDREALLALVMERVEVSIIGDNLICDRDTHSRQAPG